MNNNKHEYGRSVIKEARMSYQMAGQFHGDKLIWPTDIF